MTLPVFQVDAFTDRPFAGNPAAVCLLDGERPDEWLQAVAAEMNLSETAFIQPRTGSDEFNLRWLTPTVEVDLCGHATLASAHILWEQGLLAPSQAARFHTRSGVLTARRDGEWIVLDFPVDHAASAPAPAGLLSALGITSADVLRGRRDYLVVVPSEATLRALRPDFTALASLPVRGVMVTSPSSDPRYDFVSRFFGPGSGINEDPVTGSAHCTLTPYWAKRLGALHFTARQISRRGGELRVTLVNDGTGERVHIAGQAVTVLKGELHE